MGTLDTLIGSGKLRYAGGSNYPGWQLMKAQGIADSHGWPRLVAHQVYYSLMGRAYEAELMPVGADQGLGALVWSPLGWGRLTGKIGRDRPIPKGSRLHDTEQFAPPVETEQLYRVIDALEIVAADIGKSVPQVAINWLLRRPTVASVIIGARNEEQLRDNLGAVGWALTAEQIATLDAASSTIWKRCHPLASPSPAFRTKCGVPPRDGHAPSPFSRTDATCPAVATSGVVPPARYSFAGVSPIHEGMEDRAIDTMANENAPTQCVWPSQSPESLQPRPFLDHARAS